MNNGFIVALIQHKYYLFEIIDFTIIKYVLLFKICVIMFVFISYYSNYNLKKIILQTLYDHIFRLIGLVFTVGIN